MRKYRGDLFWITLVSAAQVPDVMASGLNWVTVFAAMVVGLFIGKMLWKPLADDAMKQNNLLVKVIREYERTDD